LFALTPEQIDLMAPAPVACAPWLKPIGCLRLDHDVAERGPDRLRHGLESYRRVLGVGDLLQGCSLQTQVEHLRDALHALDPVFAVDLFQLISLNRVFNFLPRFRLAGRSAPEPATILLEAANASPGGEAVHAGDHGTGGGGASIVREVARNPATVA
jgi:hypothetical protein